MKSSKLYDINAMLNRLANPFWSPLHPSSYALNCEGRYGPGAEFDADPKLRAAWNIFWAMSHKITSPKQVEKLNIPLMRKVIVAAIAVSRIRVRIEGIDYSVGQLSMLMNHPEFLQLLEREIHQLDREDAKDALSSLEPSTLLTVLGRRLCRPTDSSLPK